MLAKHRVGRRFPDVVPDAASNESERRSQAEALVLLAKAMQLFRLSLREVRRAVQVNFDLLTSAAVKSAIENLRMHFNDCLKGLDVLRDLGAIQHAKQLSDLLTAEEMIFEYSLTLCRQAIDDEVDTSYGEQANLTRLRHMLFSRSSISSLSMIVLSYCSNSF